MAAASAAVPYASARDLGASSAVMPQPSRAELENMLSGVVITNDPKLFKFAVDVYASCVLGKLRKADPPLNHAWLVPGGGYYAQWLWDTMFVADLLALLPGQKELIRGVFQNYWDFQTRWNAAKPNFMHGMIANFMAPYDAPGVRDGKQWRDFPAYSQAPLLAWGMERVFRRNGDMQLLREGIAPLEQFHEWYWRERDTRNLGLIGVGAYSGDAQHARYETYDREVDLDELKMELHPGRMAERDNGPWYGNLAIPANTAYLLRSEQSLARMSEFCGDHAMAKRRLARYQKGVQAMRDHMWDTASGCFLTVNVSTLEKIQPATVGGFMGLLAHVPDKQQAQQMAHALRSDDWSTPLPIPTVPQSNANFRSGEFWRGDTWPAPNYQVVSGLAEYGLRKDSERIADATVSNALKVGISERYDSMSGAPLGVAGLGMSATVLTMMLDGLTSTKYRLQIRERHA